MKLFFVNKLKKNKKQIGSFNNNLDYILLYDILIKNADKEKRLKKSKQIFEHKTR